MGSYKVEDGVVHLGKVRLDVPDTISEEAKAYLRFDTSGGQDPDAQPVPMWQMRDALAPMFDWLATQALEVFPCNVEETRIAGVRCHRVTPKDGVRHPGKLLINLHGGGFVVGSGSLVEAIPIAAETGCEVWAVDYRLAPEHPYPAAVDDVLAVYREALKDRAADDVVVYGTSAGGFLTAMAIMRFQKEGLPLPAACGVFTAGGDLTRLGDTYNYLTLAGFHGNVSAPLDSPVSERAAFLRDADPADPLVAPIRGDLSRFPPTLLVSSTRDAVLSATALFHRSLHRAGRLAELHVFEALPHGFWFSVSIPESREAIDLMARFFERHLRLDRA